jgi:hypothetical protein
MTGNDNTFIGHNTGLALEAGFRNTFIGKDAGKNTTFSFNNTFLGWGAGFSNKIGTSNTFFAEEAGAFNTGSNNSFIGKSAGLYNTSGEYNTFVGNYSGEANSTGEKNTFVGYSAGNTSEDSTLANALAIGHRSKVACSNCAVIGGTGGNSVFVGIGTTTPPRRTLGCARRSDLPRREQGAHRPVVDEKRLYLFRSQLRG